MSSQQQTLGKYQIIREIARSNDIVYEAYDPPMNRRVALKELAMPGGSTPQQQEDRVKRFEREVRAAGSLSHPNIVTIYEFGQDQGRRYMAMEYLDGHNLRNELDTKGFIPVDRALEITESVLDALEYAHSRGVVHRDIKPENIQILDSGKVKITDFGIARLTFEPNITMDGQVFGTPSYMSPEQVVGKDIDARSDIFSVGVVLYEMISGHKPFQGDSVVSITYAIMNKAPDQPTQAPWELWQVIATALDKSPALRYGSAAEMRAMIRNVRAALNSGPVIGQVAPQPRTIAGPPPFVNPTMAGPVPPMAPPMVAPTATGQPYGQPYVPPSPYGGQVPYGQQPYTGGTYQGGQLPIYYPPPPRQPLVSPETKQFLGKLGIAILILGALAALIIVGLQSLSDALQRSNAVRRDNEIRADLARPEFQENTPVDQRIEAREQAIPEISDPEQRRAEERNLATEYINQGREFEQAGRLSEAERAYRQALQNDSTSPAALSHLGSLYASRALAAAGFADRVNLHRASAEAYLAAGQNERDQDAAARHLRNAAASYYNAAVELQLAGDHATALQYLTQAKSIAPPSTELQAIDRLIERLTRG